LGGETNKTNKWIVGVPEILPGYEMRQPLLRYGIWGGFLGGLVRSDSAVDLFYLYDIYLPPFLFFFFLLLLLFLLFFGSCEDTSCLDKWSYIGDMDGSIENSVTISSSSLTIFEAGWDLTAIVTLK
jgi:hypothetical protein